jgi:Uma2 family endonuclease
MSTATRITLAEYERMIAEGKFEGGLNRPRVELIDRELREMSPINWQHVMVVAVLTEWSNMNLPAGRVWVCPQSPIGVPERDSAPEPDLAWVQRKDYSPGHPAQPDILLVVEVADSSLSYDRGEKADLYASAGITDYWVVNIPDRCVEVFRKPEGGRYRSHEVFKAPGEIRPLAFPQIVLPVELLFPSQTR